MRYIRYYEIENKFSEEYHGEKYIEPWLSLTKHAAGDVKSFVADTDPYGEGAHIEKSFGYLGVGNSVWGWPEGKFFFNDLPICSSTISAVDTENNTITVDGMVFGYGSETPYSSDKYSWFYDSEIVITQETVDSIDGMVEFDGDTYSACTVDGKTYIMDSYDSDAGLWKWYEVNLNTESWLDLFFTVDHENLVVGENVEIMQGVYYEAVTSSETPAVGDEVTYYSAYYGYVILDNRNPDIGDVYEFSDGTLTVLSTEADPGEVIDRVNYNKTEKEKEWEQLVKTPLTFEITSDGYLKTQALRADLKYKKNGGEWINLYENDSMNLAVVSGDTVQVVGFGNTVIAPRFGPGLTDCGFNLKGNIMSLCYGDAFASAKKITEMPDYGFGQFGYVFRECFGLNDASKLILPVKMLGKWCYISMFEGCTNLTSTPELPATTMTESCYQGMFMGCTSLTQAPVLPATTLADYCYGYMFQGCTSLTRAPELPAETLAIRCYYNMFDGCTNLTSAPELPAMTLAGSCYSGMFFGCTGLTTAPELPATALTNYCYQGMFRGCTSLVQAPSLPAETLTESCYNSMFYGCTNLTSAPELPATALASTCYNSMFQGCTGLNYIKCLATNISAFNSLYNWVSGVAASGTFVKASSMSSWPSGSSGIPINWTVQNA